MAWFNTKKYKVEDRRFDISFLKPQRQKSMETIAVARSKHDHLVGTVLCEKLDEISQLNTCFQSEKKQSEETRKQAAILDPITSNLIKHTVKMSLKEELCGVFSCEYLNISIIDRFNFNSK